MPLSHEETDLLREMADAARRPLQVLMATIGATQSIENCTYTVRSRIKTHDSAIKKIEKKRSDGIKENDERKKNYGPRNLTDVIGLRLVTHYRLDMLKALAHVCDLIEGAGRRDPFMAEQLTEALVFLTPDASKVDRTSVEMKALELLKERFPGARLDTREGTYSGLHVLAWLEVDRKVKCPEPYAKGVPVEIQIRSVFEDAWAEIDHFACYKNDDLKDGGPKSEIEAQVAVLKKVVDAAAGHADLIRKMKAEPDSPPSSKESGTLTKSLSAAEDIGAVLREFGIPKEVSDPIVALIDRRDRLFAKLSGKKPNPSEEQEFRDIAARLASIETEQSMPGGWLTESGHAARALDYFLKMETALAHFYAETPESIERAIDLYTDVQKNQPNSFAARYRLGQAYGKQNKTDDAIDNFNAALTLIETRGGATDSEKRLFRTDYNPDLQWRTEKLLGYQCYKKSLRYDTAKSAQEKKDYLKRAYDITTKAHPACTDEEQKRSFTNNRLYYAAEYMVVERVHQPGAAGFLDHKELNALLEDARRNLEAGGKPSHYDTVAYVANILGRSDVALATAKTLLDLLPSDENTDDENDTMIARAFKIQHPNRPAQSKG